MRIFSMSGLFWGLLFRPKIQLPVQFPSHVPVSPDIKELAIIDRVQGNTSSYAVADLQNAIRDVSVPRYKVVNVSASQQIYNDQNIRDKKSLQRDLTKSLCDTLFVQGIVSLERLEFFHDFSEYTTTETEIETETVREKGEEYEREIEREVTVYNVDLDIYVDAVWHMQDCEGKTIDQFEQNLHEQYSESANSYSDAKNRIGDEEILLMGLASSIGSDYMPRISTYDATVSRHLYRWGSKNIRKGNKYMKQGQYPEAKERYLEAKKSKNRNKKAKALLNLAVAEEFLGDYDQAVKYAQKAHRIKDSDFTEYYLKRARRQRRRNNKLQPRTEDKFETKPKEVLEREIESTPKEELEPKPKEVLEGEKESTPKEGLESKPKGGL